MIGPQERLMGWHKSLVAKGASEQEVGLGLYAFMLGVAAMLDVATQIAAHDDEEESIEFLQGIHTWVAEVTARVAAAAGRSVQ